MIANLADRADFVTPACYNDKYYYWKLPCVFYKEGEGCKIYAIRPQGCRNFKCAVLDPKSQDTIESMAECQKQVEDRIKQYKIIKEQTLKTIDKSQDK
jgi:Fe-S-cluster containining protein